MTTKKRARPQVSVRYLRSLCEQHAEPNLIDNAIRNGWTARTVTDLAVSYRNPGAWYCIQNPELARLQAMRHAATRRYESPEERARNRAELQTALEAERAQRAILATDETRPACAKEFKVYRTACKDMKDCDALSAVIAKGWSRNQLDCAARCLKRGKKITRPIRRLAMYLAQCQPAGHFPPFFTRGEEAT